MTKLIEIESIEEIEEISDVYDIEVENIHTFFANGMLVHNCLGGIFSYIVLRDQDKGSEAVFKALDLEVKPLLDIFGKDRANLEIQFNKLPEQRIVNDYILKYSKLSGYPVIATADSHYYDPAVWREREMYKLLAQQGKGFQVSGDDLPKTIDELKCELYPRNGDQMFDAYCQMYPESSDEMDADVMSAIERTYTIAHEQIEKVSPDTKMKLPSSFLKGVEPNEKLRTLCLNSLSAKSYGWTAEKERLYIDRMKTELDVITKKDFSLYFLTLKEALDKIKEHQLIGAGRGSGAGSLVCYLLGITLLDPIKHGLLFERFMSENRTEPPDIDNDIEDRDSAFEILKGHFGVDNVIAISNFNSMQLKSLVKDISKLYNVPFEEVNNVTSVMEKEAKQPILDSVGNDQKLYNFDFDGCYKFSPTFKNYIDKYPHVAETIKVLFKQNKSIGRHAGGIIITENPDEHMPIIRIRGVDQTPWGEGLTAKHLEPFGLIKYDFLGITTLRTIRSCIERILKKEGVEINSASVRQFFLKYLDPEEIGAGQKEVFEEIYHKGKFCGTFQFAERPAQAFCKEAKPENVNDLACITSIYRPGPLKSGADKKYVYLANNPDEIDFYHSVIEEVLGETRGLLVYQEQFMLLAHKLAGFTLTESDELRKLLVKPVTSLGEEMKKKRIEVGIKFVDGCIANGIDRDRAQTLWDDEILGFISYGFNKSHAVAYAYLSYQCAYLFYHYPDEWVCAYLEKDSDKEAAITEVEAAGYKIGRLDILASDKTYSVGDDKIIHPPLSSVKGIGDAAIDELIEIRKNWDAPSGATERFYDFFFETSATTLKNGKTKIKRDWKFSKFNKRGFGGLVKLEACAGLQLIPELFDNYAHMHRAFIEKWDRKDKQAFDIETLAGESSKEDWSNSEKAGHQAELLGTYDKNLLVSPEVLDFLRDSDILPLSDLSSTPQSIWFILKKIETKTTKTEKEYFKLTIMDIEGTEKVLNYFNPGPREGWEERGLYYADLVEKSGWVNVRHGNFIKRLQ